MIDSDGGSSPSPRAGGSQSGEQTRAAIGAARLGFMHVRSAKWPFLTGGLLLIGGSLLALLQPLATGWVLSDIQMDRSVRPTLVALGCLLLATLIVNYVGSVLVLRGTEKVVARSRERLARKILRLSVGQMSRSNPGDLQTRFTSDASILRLLLSQAFVQMVTASVSVVGSLIVMARLNYFMLIVVLAAMAIPASLLFISLPRIKYWSRRTQKALGLLGAEVERVLGSFTTVKANDAAHSETVAINSRIDYVFQTGVRSITWRATSQTFSVSTIQFAYVMTLVAGSIQVNKGFMDVPSLVTFLMYATQLTAPAATISTALTSIQTASASLERLADVEKMEIEDRNEDLASPRSDISAGPCVKFSGVNFGYGRELTVLKDVDISFEDRCLTGLIGPSGSGKSTILSLVDAFYQPASGEVIYRGTPISKWPIGDLRRQVAFVEQSAPVFEGSIRDNLLYGHPAPEEVTDRQCYEALDMLWPGATVSLDDSVGYRGSSLSGGQRQRLSLTRAVLRDPTVLLLDEPTAALDSQSEAEVLSALKALTSRMAIIMTAHRPTAVLACDAIVLMHGGRVQAAGRQGEVASEPLFQEIVQRQT